MAATEQRRFIQSQINEIRRYVKRFPNENPNTVILRWIEHQASQYRETWEEDDF